jgi:hypothetical protein
VAAVDPEDDDIRRYVVRRYAHDPERRERRHLVVAAFDNEREFVRLINKLHRDLQRRRAAGEAVDRSEHYSGVMLEPGYRRRQQNAHLVRRAIQHGATISDELLERLDLPSNVAILRSRSESDG